MVTVWVLVGAFVLFIGGIIVYQYRRRSSAFEAYADRLGLQVESSTEASGQWRGLDCRISYDPGGKNSPGLLYLHLESGLPEGLPEVTFRRENFFDRIGKFLELSREYQAGESEFDEAIYVEGDRERLQYLIRDQKLRRVVRSIVSEKRRSLIIEDDRIALKIKSPFGLFRSTGADDVERDFQTLKKVLEALKAARDDLPAAPSSSPPLPTNTTDQRGMLPTLVTVGIPLLLFVGGTGLFFLADQYPTFTYRLIWDGLQISGVLALVYLAVMFVINRNRPSSSSHRLFYLGAVFLVIGLPLAICSALVFTNAYWDRESPDWVPAYVVEVVYDDGQYTAGFRASFNGVTGHPEIDVSDATAKRLRERVRARKPAQLKVSPGYWEEPWVVDLRVKN